MKGRSGHPADWRPSADLQTAQCRARMLGIARDFFAEHEVLEVETPALSMAAASDPQIESIAAYLQARPGQDYFLHTSPEFAMKRLLCAGWPDIYQICRVFRDGEIGPRHQPEFTMVEWYRRGITMNEMMQHTVAFIARVLDLHEGMEQAHYISYTDAFRQHAGVDPIEDSTAALIDAAGADRQLREAVGDDRSAWLDLLLSSTVAPAFDRHRLTVLHHYPATQAALARLCTEDASLADRFEIFHGETELANGYSELNDASEQERRCASDQLTRKRSGQNERPLDLDFLAALRFGLPACCGVAIGFDRLVMVNTGATELQGVQSITAVKIERG
ncbi:MAG: EF-P lysine aminoacylase GenX [Halioglobus sp.]|nr:EF-P lysine aminoacylase GenX [Halioglobus sp.]